MADLRSGRRYKTFRAQVRVRHAMRALPCALCGRDIDYRLAYPHPAAWSLDHERAIHDGGRVYDVANCQPAHLRCNQSRGATEGNAKRLTPRHRSTRW